jgi:hypothetical protein
LDRQKYIQKVKKDISFTIKEKFIMHAQYMAEDLPLQNKKSSLKVTL